MRIIKPFCVCAVFILFGVSCSTLEKTYQKTRNAMGDLVSIVKETPLPMLERDEHVDLQFARHQFNRREYAVSEFYLKKTLANYPENREAIQLLPWVYFFQKRFDKALASFKQAHTLHKKDPTPLLGMGWCYFSLKDYQKALESFEHAERFAPNSYEAHKGKGFIHLAQKRSQLAEEELGKIFRPAKVQELLEMWEARNQGTLRWEIVPSSPESSSIFTLPVEFPRYRSLLLGMPLEDTESLDFAWKSFHQGKYTKAADFFDSLTNAESLNPDAVNGLAWSLLHAKQINKKFSQLKGNELFNLYGQNNSKTKDILFTDASQISDYVAVSSVILNILNDFEVFDRLITSSIRFRVHYDQSKYTSIDIDTNDLSKLFLNNDILKIKQSNLLFQKGVKVLG